MNRSQVAQFEPINDTDCNEAIATMDVIKENMPLAIERHKDQSDGPMWPLLAGALEAVDVQHIQNTGLEIRINLSHLSPYLNSAIIGSFEPRPPEKDEIVCKTTIADVSGRGIKVNKQFSIESKVAEFPSK